MSYQTVEVSKEDTTIILIVNVIDLMNIAATSFQKGKNRTRPTWSETKRHRAFLSSETRGKLSGLHNIFVGSTTLLRLSYTNHRPAKYLQLRARQYVST